MTKRNGKKSPYVRHAKAPTLYSAELTAWRNAVKDNKQEEAARADAAWRRKYGWRAQSAPLRYAA